MDIVLLGLFYKATEWLIEKMGEKVKDELFDAASTPIKDWIKKGFDKRKDYEFLRTAIIDSFDKTKNYFGADETSGIEIFLLEPKQQQDVNILIATAILDNNNNEFPFLEPLISSSASNADKVIYRYFIKRLREKLSTHELFSKILLCIDRYNTLEVLRSMNESIGSISKTLATIHTDSLTTKGITTDQQKSLANYLEDIIQKHSFIDVPLVHDGMSVLPKIRLKEIFIPLDIKKTNGSMSNKTTREGIPVSKNEKNHPSEDNIRKIITEQNNAFDDKTGIEKSILENDHIVVIGTPGKGKTTLLRRTVLNYAEALCIGLDVSETTLFPIFFRLRNFSIYLSQNPNKFPDPTHRAILSYLEYAYQVEGGLLTPDFFENYLSQGNCIILMDGLDEVTENKEDVAQNVIKFINKYENTDSTIISPKNKIVISSRPKGYESIRPFLSAGGLIEYEIQSINRKEIYLLISKLFSALDQNEIKNRENTEKLYAIITESDNSDDLLRIATNPLFCTALLLLYKWNSLELPQRTIDVFHEIINLLLGFWRSQQSDIKDAKRLIFTTPDKGYDVMSVVSRKWLRLSYLSYQMQLSSDISVVTLNDAIRILGDHMKDYDGISDHNVKEVARDFLNHAHEFSGILVENEPDKFSFMHEQFREYFAANYFVKLCDKDFADQILLRVLETSSSWQEILIMAMSHKDITPPRRIDIIDQLIKRANSERSKQNTDKWAKCLFMAGKVSSDSTSLLPEKEKKKVRNILNETMQDITLASTFRVEAGLVLDRLNWLPEGLFHFIEISASSRTKTMMGKFPISNFQYKRFVKSQDYLESTLWKNQIYFTSALSGLDVMEYEGLDWLYLQGENNFLPAYWDNETFGNYYKSLPVVGISWYEANAYCNWLLKNWYNLEESKNLQLPKVIRLPNEEEWILSTGRNPLTDIYPFDLTNSSIIENEILKNSNLLSDVKRTSPLGTFTTGESGTFGFYDMCGNVWEWQSNYYDIGNSAMVLKGGSFKTDFQSATILSRGMSNPGRRENDIGFRVLIEYD